MSQIIGPLLTRPDFAHAERNETALKAVDQLEALLARVALVEKENETLRQSIHALKNKTEEPAVPVKGTVLKKPEPPQIVASQQNSNQLPKTLARGDTFFFGRYPEAEYPIEWIVLNREPFYGGGGKILAISKYGLDIRAYHDVKVPVTFATCSLRIWLNTYFYNHAFNEAEKKRIQSGYPSRRGEPVFLLDYKQVQEYLSPHAERVCKLKAYKEYVADNEPWSWWLRNSHCMNINGRLGFYDVDVDVPLAVRPAIEISLAER